MADPRRNRKEELLAAARDRLTTEQDARDAGRSSTNGAPEIRYRGQVMNGGGGGTPGSGIRSTSRSGGRNSGGDDVRVALEKIKGLYHDGLISRAEAEKKRSEILDRL